MLPATEILEMYRAERSALDMPSDPFPAFADWRAEYEEEYRKNHVANYKRVDVKVAMREADALVEEAEAELEMINHEEEMEMNETNVSGVVAAVAPLNVDVDAQAPVEAVAPKAKRKVAAKPKAKVKAAPKKKAAAKKVAKPAKARVARKDNKTAAAQAIFTRMYGKKERKDVIAAFIEKVGLTPNGASTYYQKLKALAA